MNGKQLKNSILQWAIQGKLVPQNPKDEPASKLLERIAATRNGDCVSPECHPERSADDSSCHSERSAKGTKSKNLAKKKSVPVSRIYREGSSWFEQIGSAEPKDITEEMPFDIPESWEWCRLKNIASFLNGDRSKNYPNKSEYVTNGVAWINTGHITPTGYLSTETMNYISEEKFNSLGNGFIVPGDLVYCLRGATYGKIARVEPFDRGAIASSLMIIRPAIFDVREYIFLLLKTPYAKEQLNIYANGAAQPNLAAKDIEKYFVPLPPLAEQKRIVEKLEKVLPLVDEYDSAQTELDKLNAALPETLKKSLLQEAIQGKLVPQNPKDEPAGKLLERIVSSRHSEQSEAAPACHPERSAKGTKSKDLATKAKKKSAPTSRIYREGSSWYEQIGTVEPTDITDQIPFDIPETWEWCRFSELVDFRMGKTPPRADSSMWSNGVYNWVSISDMKDMQVISVTKEKLSQKAFETAFNSQISPAGTMIMSFKLTIGRISFLGVDSLHNEAIISIFPKYDEGDVFRNYLARILGEMTQYVDAAGAIKGNTLNKEKINNMLIPLPPLAEQKRIVAKLEQLLKVL